MRRAADIVIVGAGIAGLCTALQLARRGRLSIVVLDQGRGPGEGSTGASSAVCRHRYTHPEMIRLARDAIDRYRGWQDFLGTRAEPRARLHATGVLWLSGEDQDWGGAEVARLAAHGVPSALLDDRDIRARFPALSTCILSPDFGTGAEHDCIGGATHLFEETAGYMDAQDVLEDLVGALRPRGVEIRFGTPVERILVSGPGRVSGVALADGTEISCGAAVNAGGPWCNQLLMPLGLDGQWPFVPTRSQVLHLPRPREVLGELPVCVDFASGVYFRPDNRGQRLIVGSTREEDEREEVDDPSDFERFPDEDFKVRQLHALHHRLPGLPYRGRVGGYCGLYTVNRVDMHPVVGATPIDGFFVANGFSGHGFKLGPAVGSLVAQAITGERVPGDTAVPSAFLAWDREPIALEFKNVLA